MGEEFMPIAVQRQLPVGAEPAADGTHFRVWATRRKQVEVVLDRFRTFALRHERDGYFSGFAEGVQPGALYRFRFDGDGPLFPDPASRFQPEGPHGPSQIVDPSAYRWTDEHWNGVQIEGQVLYEMHIGSFTREGTWKSAIERLPKLAEIGITLLEIMPVADFAGTFGWGYDGVNLFAPTRLYGVPDDFRLFVDRAHSLGLGVILDVVYNHFGPDGNYLKEFSDEYFTTRYENEWGEALNFDGDDSGPVREFFISNAVYWIREFHLDGLRLDATQQIFDKSDDHILACISREARSVAGKRSIVLVAENEPQDTRLVRSLESGGFGLDALWNDDFHHTAHVAVTGHNEAYFSDYGGSPQEFISSIKWGHLYQGQYYTWQRKQRGSFALDLHPASFVNYIQNHDQIANSALGVRVHELASAGHYRAVAAVLLLGPATPLLFQGQEFGASSPFLYFADHHEELAKLVAAGRSEFLAQFPSLSPDKALLRGAPHERKTFEACKLDWTEWDKNSQMVAFHRDLLKLRRDDPVFSAQRSDWIQGAVLGPNAFVLRFMGGNHGDRLLVVNFGRGFRCSPNPEPLLAPPVDAEWDLLWSSDNPLYGGRGNVRMRKLGPWNISGQSATVFYERSRN
jgi:maltooligosyltrehalose trehalohydrolase